MPQGRMRTSRLALAIALASAAAPAFAQGEPAPETLDLEPPPDADYLSLPPEDVPSAQVAERQIFTIEDFARFAPRNALDMLEEVPGFTIQSEDQGRGLGQASGNILINGERFSSKSTSAREQLTRIPADSVIRIEIVDGATLDIPGLSGRVANIVYRSGGLSGQFEWRPQYSTGPSKTRWSQGDISLSGTAGGVDFTVALVNDAFYGGSAGPNFVSFPDAADDERFNTQYSVQDRPTLTGNFGFDLGNGITASLNTTAYVTIFRARENEASVAGAVPLFEERLRTTNDEYGYEIGADIELPLGPGSLKLIGLESYENGDFLTQSIIFDTGERDEGNRFGRDREEGERIGRAEYSWPLWGADWQVSVEAAFNRLDNVSSLFALDLVTGDFVEIDFPAGTGGVREDRYEATLSYGRPLTDNLSLQLTVGGEKSTISQTGSNALSRSFQRPKGSLALAWAPLEGLDLNLSVAREVGQLDFNDFLARVNLTDDNTNAGNNQLRPDQTWAIDLEVNKDLGRWGSATLTVFDRRIEDFVTIVPVGESGESRGNIDSARRYGFALDAKVQLEPAGLMGGQLDVRLDVEESNLIDPVTGLDRRFDYNSPRNLEIDFRHDVPGTNWAWGLEFRDTQQARYFRVAEAGFDYTIETFGAAYVEHKDVLGLKVRGRVGNLFDEDIVLFRTVYAGPRNTAPILFVEDRRRKIGQIFNLVVSGSF